ncbi:MAG: ribosome biogenesis GTPase Der [Saprospiraceae bacterium]|jgi:GTP-binding protein
MNSNIVAIVGRPNVGKSTLYNRLIGMREAIVDNVSGVTRDRLYGISDWNGKNFTVVDTGGFVHGSDDVFEAAIRSQVRIAMDEATAIIFLVDVTTGITDLDEEITEMLRRSKKPIFLAVNKVDNSQRHLEANEFWSLGFENTFFVSSIAGGGTGDLLDAVAEVLAPEEENKEELPKFAVVGQPNAGKSSLINALVGEERNIVTDIAGTTRDSIHTKYNKFGKEFLLIDTAGIRKKHKVEEDLEFYSVMRAIRAIDEADVCLIVIDAVDGIEAQDMNIFSLAVKRNKGIVILVNKWDLIDKETNTARDYEKGLRQKIAPFTDVPIVFISALEKQRIFKAVDNAMEVYENRTKKITTSKLNDWLQEVMAAKNPPSYRGKFIKIKYVTQLKTYYPAFAFFCNHPKHIKQDYKNYLANKLREEFNFTGVPIRLYFRQK